MFTYPIFIDQDSIHLLGARWDGKSRRWVASDRFAWLAGWWDLYKPNVAFFPDPVHHGGMVMVASWVRVVWIGPNGEIRMDKSFRSLARKFVAHMSPDGWLCVGEWWIAPDGTAIQDPALYAPDRLPGEGRRLLVSDEVVVEPAEENNRRVVRNMSPEIGPRERILFWGGDTTIVRANHFIHVFKGKYRALSVSGVWNWLIMPDGFWFVVRESGTPRFAWGFRDQCYGEIQAPSDLDLKRSVPLTGNYLHDGWLILLSGHRANGPAPTLFRFRRDGGYEAIEGVCPATWWMDRGNYRFLFTSNRLAHMVATALPVSNDLEPYHFWCEGEAYYRWGERVFFWSDANQCAYFFPGNAKIKAKHMACNSDGVLLCLEDDRTLLFIPEGDPTRMVRVPFALAVRELFEESDGIYARTADDQLFEFQVTPQPHLQAIEDK